MGQRQLLCIGSERRFVFVLYTCLRAMSDNDGCALSSTATIMALASASAFATTTASTATAYGPASSPGSAAAVPCNRDGRGDGQRGLAHGPADPADHTHPGRYSSRATD